MDWVWSSCFSSKAVWGTHIMLFDWQSTFVCLFIVVICSLCVGVDLILSSCTVFPFSCSPCFPFSHEENLHYHIQQVFLNDFWFIILVVLWFELRDPCLISKHFSLETIHQPCDICNVPSFIFSSSMCTEAFDTHGYILYVAPTRPHSGKPLNSQDS
jgi:hypothetical protein